MQTRRLLSLFMGALLGLCAGQVSAQYGGDNSPTFGSAEEARRILEEPIPQGLNLRETEGIYQRKDLAARFLDDDSLREKILRDWVRKVGSPQAKGTLGGFLVYNSDRPQEGLDLIHANVDQFRSEGKLAGAAIDQAKLIEAYSSLRMIDKAEEAIRTAESYLQGVARLPDQGELPYWKTLARALVLQSKSGHLLRAAKFEEAAREVQESNRLFASLEPLWPTVKNPRRRNNDTNAWLRGILRYAIIRTDQGELFEAEQAIREAIQFSEKRGRVRSRTELLRVISRLKLRQGDYQEGLRHIKEGLEVFETRGRSKRSQPYFWHRNTMKSHLAGLQKWDELYDEILRDDELAGQDELLIRTAKSPGVRWLAYLKNGRTSDAIAVCRDWLKGGEKVYGASHPYIAFRRGSLAVSLAQSERLEDKQEALRLFRQTYADLTISASLLNQQDHPYRVWIKSFIFESYIELLLELPEVNQPSIQAEIFSVASFSSGSSVQQAINDAAARTKISDPALAELVRKDQDTARELDAFYDFFSGASEESKQVPEVMKALEERIRSLEEQRRNYKAAIEKEFPDFAQLVAPKPVSLEQLQGQLTSKEAFLSATTFKTGFISFLVTKDGLSMAVPKLTQGQAAREVDRMRSTLDVAGMGRRAPVFDFKASFAVYQGILAPHEAGLKGKTELIVSAFGPLAQFPFAVLVDSSWQGREYPEAPWLAKRFAISYATSPTAWLAVKALAASPSGKRPLLAWGDPAYKVANREGSDAAVTTAVGGSASDAPLRARAVAITRNTPVRDLTQPMVDVVVYDNLPPLPETRDEVIALAKVLNADPAKDIILGPEATRESVLKASESGELKERSVVVFATHGLIPGDLPSLTQPALAMSGATDASLSPLLTLDDVLSLKLNADWVVLSACNTAAADGKAQEALSGLARGFFYAGSRSLLVTHWSVESESATLLTTRTFQAYRGEPGLTRAQALNRAMLSVMNEKKFSHPAFWAPYVLVGEGGS